MATETNTDVVRTTPPELNDQDWYSTEQSCTNCEEPATIFILKGNRIESVLDRVKCKKCGCKLRDAARKFRY